MNVQLMPNVEIPVDLLLVMALKALPDRTLTFSALEIPRPRGQIHIFYDQMKAEYRLTFVEEVNNAG